jgi:hypothetical protein
MTTDQMIHAAHTGIHEYRTGLEDAARAAELLAKAMQRTQAAAAKLTPFLNSPLPAVDWLGAPPVADWQATVGQVVAEVKSSLQASA